MGAPPSSTRLVAQTAIGALVQAASVETIEAVLSIHTPGVPEVRMAREGAEQADQDGRDPELPLQARPHHHRARDEGQMDQQGLDRPHRDGRQRQIVRLGIVEEGAGVHAHLQERREEGLPLRAASPHEGNRRRQALAIPRGKRPFFI